MNNVELHILNTTGILNPFYDQIEETFDQSVADVTEKLPLLKNVDVVVFDDPRSTIKELGIGGLCFSANHVLLQKGLQIILILK